MTPVRIAFFYQPARTDALARWAALSGVEVVAEDVVGGVEGHLGDPRPAGRWRCCPEAGPEAGTDKLSGMGYRPVSRMDALLEQLCIEHGWCLRPEDREALIAAGSTDREAIIDSVIRAELGDSALSDGAKRVWLSPIVDDWLFDPVGRGARSGLPL